MLISMRTKQERCKIFISLLQSIFPCLSIDPQELEFIQHGLIKALLFLFMSMKRLENGYARMDLKSWVRAIPKMK